MKLYLVRHGQTEWNVLGKIQGSTDIPLNDLGRRQAERLVAGMQRRPVRRIFSSRLKRAVETAEAIARSQGRAIEVLEGLEEVYFGKWEGMTWEGIQLQFPEEYQSWWNNPAEVTPPEAESQAAVQQRCASVLGKILDQAQEEDTAIVSHGATIAYIVSWLMRESPKKPEEIIVGNASITTLEIDVRTRNCSLLQENDVCHLNGMTEL